MSAAGRKSVASLLEVAEALADRETSYPSRRRPDRLVILGRTAASRRLKIVDTEADGTVHGIELLCTPAELTAEERSALVGRFPVAAEALAAIECLTGFSA